MIDQIAQATIAHLRQRDSRVEIQDSGLSAQLGLGHNPCLEINQHGYTIRCEGMGCGNIIFCDGFVEIINRLGVSCWTNADFDWGASYQSMSVEYAHPDFLDLLTNYASELVDRYITLRSAFDVKVNNVLRAAFDE